MSTNVRETILSALPREAQSGQYSQYVNAAVSAVERRDSEIADSIRQTATQAGVNREQVEAALRESGLVAQPQAMAAPTGDGGSDLAAQVASLAQNVERLMGVARSRGLL
jgi:hypothetical protein